MAKRQLGTAASESTHLLTMADGDARYGASGAQNLWLGSYFDSATSGTTVLTVGSVSGVVVKANRRIRAIFQADGGWYGTVPGDTFALSIRVDGTAIVSGVPIQIIGAYTYLPLGNMIGQSSSLTAGPHTFDIQVYRTGGTGSLQMRGRLIIDDVGPATISDVTFAQEAKSGFRNFVRNGNFGVCQLPSSVSVGVGASGQSADGWQLFNSNASSGNATTWTLSTEDGTTFPYATSRRSLKILCTNGDASLGANDGVYLTQAVEGRDLQHIMKGRTGAKPVTASFWAYSSINATAVLQLYDATNNRVCSKTYVLLAGVATKIEIPYPADTTGAFPIANSAGMYVTFWVAAGSGYQSGTLQTTWGTLVQANQAVGQTNIGATTGNYLQLTDIQVETGSRATEFERIIHSVELVRNMRQYQRWLGAVSIGNGFASHTTQAIITIPLLSPMRAVPTAAFSSTSNWRLTDGVSVWTPSGQPSFYASRVNTEGDVDQLVVAVPHSGSLTAFRSYQLLAGVSDAFSLDARL